MAPGRRTRAIIDLWRDRDSPDFEYFERVEQSTDDFWKPDAQFRAQFDRLDRVKVLEIACGAGRHAERAAPLCRRLVLTDTSEEALALARARLQEHPHVQAVLSVDGLTVPVDEAASFTAVFSYDAMVHFESACVASYLAEISRLLAPGGMALLHHSNYDAQPAAEATDAPGWRNFMNVALLEHLASRCGLEVVQQETFDWVAPLSDALSLLRKPATVQTGDRPTTTTRRPQTANEPSGDGAQEHPEWLRRMRQARDEVIPWIEASIPLDGRTVLEYGCGQGAVSCALAERAGRHIGLDIDAGAIALARDHARRRGIDDGELHAAREEEILQLARAYSGEVDVFVLYAVLEHLSIDERLAVLRVAREVVRPDGHIVICESPNRLTPLDHHTSRMAFLHALPDQLAASHYGRSPRREFVLAMDAAAAAGADPLHRALTRWGTGLSFHELELVFEDLAAHTVASSYHPLLYPGRPVRWEELQLAATLEAWRADLPPCWSRRWLDTILSARPLTAQPEHVRPWQLRLEHDVPGAAMLPDGLLELRPGARVPIRLPAPVAEIHVGLLSAHSAERALRIHTPDGGELAPRAVASLHGIPTWHAVARLAEPAQELELSLPDGGCVSYVGHPGPPDPLVTEGRPRGW